MRTATQRVYTALPRSLQIHMAEAVDSRLAAAAPAVSSLAFFTTITHNDAGPFVRNPDCWITGVDLTSVSPSNSTEDNERGGVAITKRHIIYAKHTQIGDGASVRFCTSSDVAVARTQTQHAEIGGTFPIFPDFCVGLLDSDLPSTIAVCKVAPDYMLPKIGYFPPIPVIQTDKDENGLVFDATSFSYGSQGINTANVKIPVNAKRLEFYQPIIAGDSGDPWFVLINDELVLIGITSGLDVADGSAVFGSCPIGLNGAINAAIVAADALGGVSTGYTVTNPNLSAF